MSVAVLPTPVFLEKYGWPATQEPVVAGDDDVDRRTPQFDMWSAVQVQKDPAAYAAALPSVFSPMRLSSSSLSERSLQLCTESLGSETGSDDFSSSSDELEADSPLFEIGVEEEESNEQVREEGRVWIEKRAEEHLRWPRRSGKELASVNYHYGVGRRSSPARAFPPPLSSISRRDGPCFHMRPRRCEGRLVVEAVAVPSRNYLHAHREGGRLLLSLVDAVVNDASSGATAEIELPINDRETNAINENEAAEEQDDGDDDEEDEQVQVIDGETMIEVKISTQPQQQTGSAGRVLCSSLVINKSVSSSSSEPDHSPPDDDADADSDASAATSTINAAMFADRQSQERRPTTAMAAAAVVAASTLSASETHMRADNKLLFTSKPRSRAELLQHGEVRRAAAAIVHLGALLHCHLLLLARAAALYIRI